MIRVSFDKKNNTLDLFFEDYEREYSYSLGNGILSILNYNLSILDSKINNHIKKAIEYEDVNENEAFEFFTSFHNDLIEFHPFFIGLLDSDLQISLIESFVIYLLEKNLLNGYKYSYTTMPSPTLKEKVEPQINGYNFIEIIQKLIPVFDGFIEEAVGDDFLEKVSKAYDFFIPEEVILAMYYYNKYCIYYEREGGFHIHFHSLKVKEHEIKYLKESTEEFIDNIIVSEKSNIDTVYKISALKIFNYLHSDRNDELLPFLHSFKSTDIICDQESMEYEIDNFYGLIILESILMAEHNIEFFRCKKCNSYIMMKNSTGCKYCDKQGIIKKDEIRKFYGDHIKWFGNYITLVGRKNVAKSDKLLDLKPYYENIIIDLRDKTRTNIITIQQFKNSLDYLKQTIKEFDINEFDIYKKYLLDLIYKLKTDEIIFFTEGNEMGFYNLIHKPLK